MMSNIFIERMDGNEANFSRVMSVVVFRSAAHEHPGYEIFRRVREKHEVDC